MANSSSAPSNEALTEPGRVGRLSGSPFSISGGRRASSVAAANHRYSRSAACRRRGHSRPTARRAPPPRRASPRHRRHPRGRGPPPRIAAVIRKSPGSASPPTPASCRCSRCSATRAWRRSTWPAWRVDRGLARQPPRPQHPGDVAAGPGGRRPRRPGRVDARLVERLPVLPDPADPVRHVQRPPGAAERGGDFGRRVRGADRVARGRARRRRERRRRRARSRWCCGTATWRSRCSPWRW